MQDQLGRLIEKDIAFKLLRSPGMEMPKNPDKLHQLVLKLLTYYKGISEG